jgi:HK97 family phage portal protein
MKLFDRVRHAVTAFGAAWSGPGDIRQWPTVIQWSGPTNSGVRVTDHLAQTLSAVWACGSLLADTVSQAPVGLFRRDGDNVTKIDPKDHPVAALFDRGFNADLSTTMAVYTGQSQIGIGGNSYFKIARDRDGSPMSLHLLDPYTTFPRLADNVPYDIVKDYESNYMGRSFVYDPSDIVHVRGHTTRGVIGLSPIGAAREAIGLGLAQEKFGSKFFGNDAKSGGFIIQTGETNARQKRQKQQSLISDEDGGQGGPELAHVPKVLDPGSKYIPVTISPEDSQFLESRAFQVAEIARFYRVPLVFLDSSSATAWGSGIEQLKIGFVELTINPLSDRWADELTRKLLTPEEQAEGYYVDLDTGVLLLGDMKSRGEFYSKAIQAGWLVRNEARKRERMNPLPGLDLPLMPVNMQDGSKPPEPQQSAQGNDNAPPDDDADN